MSTRRVSRFHEKAFKLAALATTAAAGAGLAARGITAAVRTGGSVHLTATTFYPGQGTWTGTNDSVADGGRQTQVSPDGGQATILLIAGVGYVQTNARGLTEMFGLSPDQAARYAGRWISLKHGQQLGQGSYDEVTSGISLPSLAASMAISAPKKLVTPAIGVQGKLTTKLLPAGASGAVYVANNATLRPVQFKIALPGSIKSTDTFSKWHEKVYLTTPADAVPATVVSSPSATA
jgi:hypothetical protein